MTFGMCYIAQVLLLSRVLLLSIQVHLVVFKRAPWLYKRPLDLKMCWSSFLVNSSAVLLHPVVWKRLTCLTLSFFPLHFFLIIHLCTNYSSIQTCYSESLFSICLILYVKWNQTPLEYGPKGHMGAWIWQVCIMTIMPIVWFDWWQRCLWQWWQHDR